MHKVSDTVLKKTIIRASSSVIKEKQRFLKTPLSVLENMVDLSGIKEELSYVGQECWLAGGSVFRLLSGCEAGLDNTGYDRDFFFPNRKALISIFEKMVQGEYQIIRFSFSKRKIIHRTVVNGADMIFLDTSPDGIIANDAVQEYLHREDLIAAELLSTQGIRYQLIAGFQGDDPVEIISHFDYTLCQFALDRNTIYSGSHTWSDLVDRKLRHTGNATNIQTVWRFYKFMKLGYRPTARSIVALFTALLLTPTFIGR